MKKSLNIGYMPTVDHLILGIAEHNDQQLDLKTTPFTNWPTITEALTTGAIDGAFLLFPLAFDLFKKGVDLRLVLLGHREGQILVARKEITDIQGLKGKTIFVPDTHATHHILLHLILQNAGLSLDDVIVKTDFEHPKDMPDLLKEGAIDAFVSAEPMVTKALENGEAHILTLSHNISAHHVDCVLVMQQDVIEQKPEAIQELVESLVKAGLFINAYPRQAAEIGEPFLNWPKKLLLKSLTHDRAHILFWDLLPRPEEFARLQDIAVNEMHLWDEGVDLEKIIEPSFAQHAYREWVLDTRKTIKDRGENRTLPGDMIDTQKRFASFFGIPVSVAGLRFIDRGKKYPSALTKITEIPYTRIEFLEEIFTGTSYLLQTPEGKRKGVAFLSPEKEIEPDRVIFKLAQEHALKVLQALSWGDKLPEVQEYSEETADIDLFAPKDTISAVQYGDTVYFSMNFTVFRFLALLLHHL